MIRTNVNAQRSGQKMAARRSKYSLREFSANYGIAKGLGVDLKKANNVYGFQSYDGQRNVGI